jgi:exportin-2 (importin alpha re-exporter)
VTQNASGDTDLLRGLFAALKYVCKIFYSLNALDIPAYFETAKSVWLEGFHQLLTFTTTNKALLDEGAVFKLQSEICNCLNLYMERYEFLFKKPPVLPTFVQDVWNLLSRTDLDVDYDGLVISSLGFLTAIASGTEHSVFAGEPLKILCTQVVIPNIQIREVDEDDFEGTPEQYITTDLEGSDSTTRRRAATELVRGLAKNFESEVTQIFVAEIGAMVQAYTADPGKNWKAKDAAIYLVTALAVKGSTAVGGVTETNAMVPIESWTADHMLPELSARTQPILLASVLKFLTTFRNQIPAPVWMQQVFPAIVGLLPTGNYVVDVYACNCLERTFIVRDGKSCFRL